MITDKEICCESMRTRIREVLELRYSKQDSHIYYELSTREYFWCVNDDFIEQLYYCPWCGKKLPEWLDPDNVIMEEYGEDYIKCREEPGYKELPPEVKKEFETDEWWKKRNIGPDENELTWLGIL